MSPTATEAPLFAGANQSGTVRKPAEIIETPEDQTVVPPDAGANLWKSLAVTPSRPGARRIHLSSSRKTAQGLKVPVRSCVGAGSPATAVSPSGESVGDSRSRARDEPPLRMIHGYPPRLPPPGSAMLPRLTLLRDYGNPPIGPDGSRPAVDDSGTSLSPPKPS